MKDRLQTGIKIFTTHILTKKKKKVYRGGERRGIIQRVQSLLNTIIKS